MNPEDVPAPTAEERMALACQLHQFFIDLVDTPRATWPTAFARRVEERPNDPVAMKARVMTSTTEGHSTVLACVQWAHAGFPKITMGHRFAASLLVTTATEEAVLAARAPFPAFTIDIPDRLLEIDDPERPAQLLSLRSVLVSTIPHPDDQDLFAWSFTAHAERNVCVYRTNVQSVDMQLRLHSEIENMEVDAFQLEATGRDERVLWLVGRLIINTCLAMSDPSQVREVGKAHEAWTHRSHGGNMRASPEPVVRFFQLGRPVKHDFRQAVGEYLRGERRRLGVQSFVAGHYKMQPHGPKNGLRKLIWREPFWRGPEDAPIVLRPHDLGHEPR